MSEIATKERILDAAEKLFCDKGFSATSLRSITKAAGVNTAAVHYHYGSREGLMAAVVRRRAEPVNRERLRLLSKLRERHPDGPLPLELVIRAFVEPAVRHLRGGDAGMPNPMPKLVGRALAETDPGLHGVLESVFSEVRRKFTDALQQCLGTGNEAMVHERIRFMVGAMAFAVVAPDLGQDAVRVRARMDQFIDHLVHFLSAGMLAPIPASSEERS